jgi:hypothetical protein
MTKGAWWFRLPQAWRDTARKTRTALRWRPSGSDPLASLVETARSLDYGAGRVHRGEEPSR